MLAGFVRRNRYKIAIFALMTLASAIYSILQSKPGDGPPAPAQDDAGSAGAREVAARPRPRGGPPRRPEQASGGGRTWPAALRRWR